jgi:hypothetical protein
MAIKRAKKAKQLSNVQRCRVCGCTEERACPGGCTWVRPDLCSACSNLHVIQFTMPLWLYLRLQRVAAKLKLKPTQVINRAVSEAIGSLKMEATARD